MERSTIREAYQRRLIRLQEAKGDDVLNTRYTIDSPEEKDYEDDLEKKMASEDDSVPLRTARETEPNSKSVDGTEEVKANGGEEQVNNSEGTINGKPNIEPKKEKFKPRVN